MRICVNLEHIIDTAYTYLDPHGVPSAGDWAFQYNGAIVLSGTENVTITNCLFSRLDGNGIMLFGYNRNASITYNEFAWIGDSCIGSWVIQKDLNLIHH